VLRIIRLARIFKLGGRYGKFQVVSKAMLVSLDVLGVLFFLMVITVIIFATLVYYTEYPPPDKEPFMSNPQAFTSIPESFWWAMVTVNTVGYGDVVPVTLWGKIVAGGLMVVGLLIMALPVSVIGTNFTAEWMDYKVRRPSCPFPLVHPFAIAFSHHS
jgi:voltage-gated potassium channel Kch